ncbi:hypothetical protein ON010_g5407 [Phytophthora cinnamomi]|nr:hypothetical protein ON010_g5407 [Phytophthora cinnamomi]
MYPFGSGSGSRTSEISGSGSGNQADPGIWGSGTQVEFAWKCSSGLLTAGKRILAPLDVRCGDWIWLHTHPKTTKRQQAALTPQRLKFALDNASAFAWNRDRHWPTKKQQGNGKYDKGRPTKSQQGPITHHKATTRPDPDPGRQIQVGNHLIWTKNREQSEDFRAAPPDPRVSPRRSYFNTWTLQKLPEEQDSALPTGTQGEEFSTDHGSSEYPLR